MGLSELSRFVGTAGRVLQTAAKSLLPGDYLILGVLLAGIVWLFANTWQSGSAEYIVIRQGGKVHSVQSLQQHKHVRISGPMGETVIEILPGQARIAASPCNNQYCVHQGWLRRIGQASVCIPNQVSLSLLGKDAPYDGMAY
jgi:hypothetical protein